MLYTKASVVSEGCARYLVGSANIWLAKYENLRNLLDFATQIFNQALCILDERLGASSEERGPFVGGEGDLRLHLQQHSPKLPLLDHANRTNKYPRKPRYMSKVSRVGVKRVNPNP